MVGKPSELVKAQPSPGVALPAFLDIEASGFGRASYPIEVGFVLPEGESFCTLIKPAPHWTHWDPAAEEKHCISRDTLVRHGRSVIEVAQMLNDRLRGRTLFSDGWAHDYPWLAALYEEADLLPKFRLESLRSLLTDDEARDWHGARQQLGAESQLPRHRASSDARMLQMTLRRLRS